MAYEMPDPTKIRGLDAFVDARAGLENRLAELRTEFDGVPMTADARAEDMDIRKMLDSVIEPAIAELEARQRDAEARARHPQSTELPAEPAVRVPGTGRRTRTPEDIHDLSAYRGFANSPEEETRAMRDGARREIEQAVFPNPNTDADKARANIERLLARDHTGELARNILATSHPLYVRAMPRAVYGRPLTSEQARAVDQVERAIATVGTTTTGGYAIPYTFDPSLILTSNGAANPLRQISRVETLVAGNTWKGVSTDGLTLSYGVAEAQAVTEGSPTLGQPTVTAQPVKAEIDFSIESDEDWPQLQAEMARLLQDGRDTLEADQFINGTGATVYPEGVVYGLAATSDVGTTGDGFTIDDIGRFFARIPDRFEPNTSVVGHRAIFNRIDDLQAALGFGRSIDQAGAPNLKGYPRYNSSAMTSTYADGDEILIAGDFRAGFLIVDKVGLTIELDPHVRDGNGKWTGQRALLAHWRNSSVILVDNAFRLLKVGVVTTGV